MTNPPKALLFDIGGVCVVSPFQAILDYELAYGIPAGYVNFAISRGTPNGSWHKVERGEIPLDDAYFTLFKADLESEECWKAYWVKLHGQDQADAAPPVPEINAKKLFWNMMRVSRAPDPWMYPALHKLRASGKFVMAALSNTVIFPPGIKDENHEVFESKLRYEGGQENLKALLGPSGPQMEGTPIGSDIRAVFDTYVSSAHVGMRKPDPAIYKYAAKEVDAIGKSKGGSGIDIQDILFLDDIGQNLRTARQLGMRTLKVTLGNSKDAVRELEKITGLQLIDEDASKARL